MLYSVNLIKKFTVLNWGSKLRVQNKNGQQPTDIQNLVASIITVQNKLLLYGILSKERKGKKKGVSKHHSCAKIQYNIEEGSVARHLYCR